ncbi:hypothetical protein BDZ97DRAFT_5333 [Flammula alnicola]|nr:hypothetical protein BDZ97DRAFT_5333 [Flammula alnicola]
MAERSRSLAAPPEASSSNVLSLTSALLSALPKRNSEQFLLAYAQEQRRFRKEYAADGQKEVASWNQLGQDPAYKADLAQSSSSGKLGNFVFGTPVLKARVSKSGADAPSMHLRKSQDKAPVRVTTGVVVETQLPATAVREQTTSESVTLALKSTRHNNATGSNAIPATLRNDNKAKKRSIHRDNSSNDEQENRLSERQQRKKVKKDIMKPKTKGNSDEEKSLERSRSHKQRKNLTKAQTGFALMHGFSATKLAKTDSHWIRYSIILASSRKVRHPMRPKFPGSSQRSKTPKQPTSQNPNSQQEARSDGSLCSFPVYLRVC